MKTTSRGSHSSTVRRVGPLRSACWYDLCLRHEVCESLGCSRAAMLSSLEEATFLLNDLLAKVVTLVLDGDATALAVPVKACGCAKQEEDGG